MKQEWITRPYREDDEYKLFELASIMYPQATLQMDEWVKRWRWWYQQNPAGEGLIRLAEVNDRIVGQHMMAPLKVMVNGHVTTYCMGMEAMTHPDFRRQGMFKRLTEEVFADAEKRGIYVQTGMPNKLSGAQYAKIQGWFKVASINVAIKPLNWQKVIGFKIKNKVLGQIITTGAKLLYDRSFSSHLPKIHGLTFHKITIFDQKFDHLWNKISGRSPIMTVRDSQYLNWRFNIPGQRYSIYSAEQGQQVRGYIVIGERPLRNARVGHIADLVADADEILLPLLAHGIEVSRQTGIDMLAYSFLASKVYTLSLKKTNFMFYPFFKDSYLGVYSKSSDIAPEFLKDSDNWFFQHSDTDTI